MGLERRWDSVGGTLFGWTRSIVKSLTAVVIGVVAVAFLVVTGSVSAEAAARRASARKTSRKTSATAVNSARPGTRTALKSAARTKGGGLYSTRRLSSRRARRARARAAALARELADTVLPRYKVDAAGELVPDIKAEAAIVLDPVTHEVLWEENSQDRRSIASITKVMTAFVALERQSDLAEPIEIERVDVARASTTYLRARDRVTRRDLIHLLLIASDNAAARALARIHPGGADRFIERMNQMALEFGLQDTRYTDPSGLFSDNMSSAYDMARLIVMASQDARIASVMQNAVYTVRTPKRDISVRNTSHILVDRLGLEVKAAKTGFISRSGYCLATLLRLPESGHEVAVVVLGARSNAGRFLETRNLIEWFAAKTSTVFATATPATPLGGVPAAALP